MTTTIARISSTRLLIQAARATPNACRRVIKEAWPQIIGLHFLHAGASQFFSFAMETIRDLGREDLALIGLIAGTELIFTLIWSALWVMIIAASLLRAEGQTPPAVGESFNRLMIEQVRSLASVLWRTPLLLIPALTRYIRLSFVPLVVLLNPRYAQGEVDALEASSELSRGHFWLLSATILASGVLPWMAEELARGESGAFLWLNPLGVITGWLLTLIIN